MIDLHTHTLVSDGTLSPGELVELGARAGLSALAVTDHDTVDGLSEASEAARGLNLKFVPGCELSVSFGQLNMHILGLWLSPRPLALSQALAKLREKRHERNRGIILKLRTLGFNISYEEVLHLAQGAVGRPHIAQAMLAKGIAKSFDECFERYLGRKGKAYLPKEKLSLSQAIELLKREQATIILAHPYFLGLQGNPLRDTLRNFRDLGLDGIEAYYSEHTPGMTRTYLGLAHALGLAVSGGSDFHGSIRPDVKLGVGRGKLLIPDSVLDNLIKHRRNLGQPA